MKSTHTKTAQNWLVVVVRKISCLSSVPFNLYTEDIFTNTFCTRKTVMGIGGRKVN